MTTSPHSRHRLRLTARAVRSTRLLSAAVLAAVWFPQAGPAQTNRARVEPIRSAAVDPATAETIRRRPPAPYTLHGSINGSQANPLADHPLANLLDRASRQNLLNIEFYGYLDQGITLNPDSPRDRKNGPVLNNYRSNAYQMNGLYLVAERKVDPDCPCVQLGGRIDTLYGTDAEFGLSTGLDEDIVSDRANRFYKLAFPQMYGNLFLPIGSGVSCKVGKFFSPVGNEWLYNTENFFYSHFLSWNIQPGTHTGAFAEFKLTDSIEIRCGPNLGWNTSEDSNRNISWVGSIDWKSRDERTDIYFAIQTGKQRTAITVADSQVTVYSLIINQDLWSRWHYMFEHDLLVSNSRTGTLSDEFESYSVANYLFYTINHKWRVGLRLEWLRDDDGTLAGFEPARAVGPGSYYNLTLGVNWHPREHLRIRPEIRGDWQVRDSAADPPAFNDGTSTTQWLIACDVLWEF